MVEGGEISRKYLMAGDDFECLPDQELCSRTLTGSKSFSLFDP